MNDIQKPDSIPTQSPGDFLDRANLGLTILVKLIVVGILVSVFIGGKSIYGQYAHYGPDCKDNANSFQYWIDQKSVKGKVVSVHKARLQAENGTTQCFGQFQLEGGGYSTWTGSVSELSTKEVIGWANVSE